ncbi:MAG TPA: ClpX C4-type zinc finger protein [Acidimicrobiales bacterium]|nr:ClpX C4-type zinc finger protein [Acidimicrobiales bacterium]
MTIAEQLPSCSFCLRAYTDVGTLVAGPGVYICDECVDLSSHLIAGRPRSGSTEPVQRIAPWDAEAGLDAVLASLPRVAQAGKQAEYVLTQYVRKARQLGATWATIGQALGMARQSAWERFSGEE